MFFSKRRRWVLWKRLLYTKSARFFSFSIKRATTKKKVVSATSSGSVYIVVFKRRFLDVLTLLVEKARRSFFLRGKRSIGKKRPSARSAFLKSIRFARELIDRSIETTAREESRDITIRTVAIERQQQQQR